MTRPTDFDTRQNLLLLFEYSKINGVKASKQSKSSVDVWMLRDNLKLSYEGRVELHQKTMLS